MSAAAYTTYYNMITRGSCDLAMITDALNKKYVTTAEADKLRAYWHQLNDPKAVLDFAASINANREAVLTWSSPSRGQVEVGFQGATTLVDASLRTYVQSGLSDEGGELSFTAKHLINATYGAQASATVTLPPLAQPTPTPEPTPAPALETGSATGQEQAPPQEA